MPRPDSVTIELTSKQRDQLRNLTGTDHEEVMFEKVSARGGQVAAKASLAPKTPLSGKGDIFGTTGELPSGANIPPGLKHDG